MGYDCPEKKARRERAVRRAVAKLQSSGRPLPEDKTDDQDVKHSNVVTVILPEIHQLGGAVYLRVRVRGKLIYALLDTGCEESLIGRKCLPPDVQMKASDVRLLAANGTRIPLLGNIMLQVQTDSSTSDTVFLVSDNVSEMILGIDWLN